MAYHFFLLFMAFMVKSASFLDRFFVKNIERFCDVVYPRHCICCGVVARPLDPLRAGLRFFCESCEAELKPVCAPHCPKCGAPYYGLVKGERICPHCRVLRPVFKHGRTLLKMHRSAKALIHELKYREGRYLLPDIRRLVRRSPGYLDFLKGAVLVPVPLHARRLRERGYNQSLLITECLAVEAHGATIAQLLKRHIDTPSQTRRNRAQRRKNVRTAFIVEDKTRIDPDRRYIIVDDVFTTGSTLNACARALLSGGATQVDVVTLGHG